MTFLFGSFGMDAEFSIFRILFFTVFILMIGMFIAFAVKALSQWNKNNHSPRLTVPATVVAKRSDVSHHRHGGSTGMHNTTHSTAYFVTFQVESGDRLELRVAGYEFGMLIEGDRGKLTFQGTRYIGFERSLDGTL